MTSWPHHIPSPQDAVTHNWNSICNTFLWGTHPPVARPSTESSSFSSSSSASAAYRHVLDPPPPSSSAQIRATPVATTQRRTPSNLSEYNNTTSREVAMSSKKRKECATSEEDEDPDAEEDDHHHTAAPLILLERIKELEGIIDETKESVQLLISTMSQQISVISQQQRDLHESLKVMLQDRIVKGLESLGNGIAESIKSGFEKLEGDIEDLKATRFPVTSSSSTEIDFRPPALSEKTKGHLTSLTSAKITRVPEISSGLSFIIAKLEEEGKDKDKDKGKGKDKDKATTRGKRGVLVKKVCEEEK